MKKCLVLFSFLMFAFSIYGQDNSARLVVLQGSDISFNFNRISDYQNGIEINDGTIIGISFADIPSANTAIGWRIEMATNGATTIDGESASNSLPLQTIEVRAQQEAGLAIGTTYNQATQTDYQFLGSNIPIVESTQVPCTAADDQINIDYRCGVTNGSLLGQAPDYYTIEIELTLIPEF